MPKKLQRTDCATYLHGIVFGSLIKDSMKIKDFSLLVEQFYK
jgi:hypothetical protein